MPVNLEEIENISGLSKIGVPFILQEDFHLVFTGTVNKEVYDFHVWLAEDEDYVQGFVFETKISSNHDANFETIKKNGIIFTYYGNEIDSISIETINRHLSITKRRDDFAVEKLVLTEDIRVRSTHDTDSP